MRTSLPRRLSTLLKTLLEKLGGSPALVIVLLILGLLLAKPLIAMVAKGAWVMVLLAFTALLVVPDALWVWREHPGVVRRVARFLTHPRTLRVLLYLLLAVLWWAMLG